MSETHTDEPVADTIDDDSPAEETPTTPPESEKTFTASELDRIIERRLERERAKYADYDKLRTDAEDLLALREADQAEIQKAIERAEAAEQRIAQAEHNALRAKIAAEKGVPTSTLVGDTEEELIASADELIAWRDQNKQQPTTSPTPKRSPSTSSGLKSGATGTENTNPDPKAAAAEALRRLRQG
jgi:hypothetical protein